MTIGVFCAVILYTVVALLIIVIDEDSICHKKLFR